MTRSDDIDPRVEAGALLSPNPPPATFVDALQRQSRARGASTAIRFLADGEERVESLSYAALDERAKQIAAHLQQIVLPGDRVALLLPPGLSYVAGFLGCLYAGAVAVPIYPPVAVQGARSLARVASILADCRPRASITSDAFRASLGSLADLHSAWRQNQWIAIDDLTRGDTPAWREPGIDASSVAFLQYTSGSVEAPAGVLVSHQNLLSQQVALQEAVGTTAASVVVSWLPPYHDMGLIGTILHPLYVGCTAVLLSPTDFLVRPVRWLRAMTRYGGTHSVAPNFGYELCARRVAADERRSLDLHRWRVALNGAEPVRADTLERFAAAFEECGFARSAFAPCYGLAEATLLVTGTPIDRGAKTWLVSARALSEDRFEIAESETTATQRLVSSGVPPSTCRIALVRPATIDPCPDGHVGEILVAGPSVTAGYWGEAGKSRDCFVARLADGREGPFVRTGDLGSMHEGELVVTGRSKEVLNVRGRNLYPQDVERTVARCHATFRDGCGAAFALEVDAEERLVVVQEVRHTAASEVDVAELGRAVRAAVLEEHEVQLHALVLIPARTLPKTSSGKVQRAACRAALEANQLEVVARWSTTTPAIDARQESDPRLSEDESPCALGRAANDTTIARWLVEHLASVRGLSPGEIEPAMRFVDLGIDSAEAALLSWEIEEWLGKSVPLTLIWDHPTIELLARHLASAPTDAAAIDAAMPEAAA